MARFSSLRWRGNRPSITGTSARAARERGTAIGFFVVPASPSSLSLLSAAVWPTSDIALLLRGWWDLLFPPTCLASAQGSVVVPPQL